MFKYNDKPGLNYMLKVNIYIMFEHKLVPGFVAANHNVGIGLVLVWSALKLDMRPGQSG